MHGDETGDFVAFHEPVDHVGEGNVAKTVAVVGQKDLLVFDQMTDREESLTDITPDSGIDRVTFQSGGCSARTLTSLP